MKSKTALWLSAKTNYDIPPPKHSHHRKHEHERRNDIDETDRCAIIYYDFLVSFHLGHGYGSGEMFSENSLERMPLSCIFILVADAVLQI